MSSITEKLEQATSKIDALENETDKTMTAAQFADYVSDQLGKAEGESGDVRKTRLDALKIAIAAAKASFESSSTAKIAVFKDPFQTSPTTKTVDAPANLPALNDGDVQFDPAVNKTGVTTFAAKCLSIAKKLAKADSAERVELSKSDDAAAKTLFAKAGPASAMLSHIATTFGLDPNEDYGYDGIAWKVREMIRAVEEAAKLERAMATVTAAFSGAGAPTAEVQASMDARQESAKTTKAAQSADEGWPLDMTVGLEPKARGIKKTVGDKPMWGRDGEAAS